MSVHCQEFTAYRKERGKMLLSRRNQLLLEFSFWNEPVPRTGPNVYELRTYQLRVSGWAAACIVVRTGLNVLKSDFQNVFYSSKMQQKQKHWNRWLYSVRISYTKFNNDALKAKRTISVWNQQVASLTNVSFWWFSLLIFCIYYTLKLCLSVSLYSSDCSLVYT